MISEPKNAAVLIPIYRHPQTNGLHLVIIRRTPGGSHSGQLAFPGGGAEPEDDSLTTTAIRETHEEIGLPPENITIVADFPAVQTFNDRYRVHPFLARIVPLDKWIPDPAEVAEVIDVSLDYLTAPETHTEEDWYFERWDMTRRIPFYRIGPHPLWGLTYHILTPLLPRIMKGEWQF